MSEALDDNEKLVLHDGVVDHQGEDGEDAKVRMKLSSIEFALLADEEIIRTLEGKRN